MASSCFVTRISELEFAEREYRCLDKWEENGVMYTFTERRDSPGYECFVGAIVREDENFITEAGKNCQRTKEPLPNGMKLVRKGTCVRAGLHECRCCLLHGA